MNRRRVFLNAAFSVSQILVLGAVLFALLWYLKRALGLERLGVWSVVIATTSMTRIASLGLGQSVVKYVAKYNALEKVDDVSRVIQTTAISLSVLILVVLAIVYPLAGFILSVVIVPEFLNEALEILPITLISLWMNIVAGVFFSGLDGLQRMGRRSAVVMIASVIHFGMCLWMVGDFGLKGLAYAQLIQAGLLMFGSWVMLKQIVPALPMVPFRWDKGLFKEMIGYGVNFQIITVCQMLYDPITKSLLSRFGGLAATGIYEMASRMIIQFRAMLIAANGVLVPVVADNQERSPNDNVEIYQKSYDLIYYLSIPLFFALAGLAPVLGVLWLGEHNPTFILFAVILSLGWMVNMLAAPGYFAYLGIGNLKWNTVSHIVIGVLGASSGFVCGLYFGGMGVVLSWSISIVVGSLIVPFSIKREFQIPFSAMIPKGSRMLTMVSVSAASASLIVFLFLRSAVGDALAGVSAILVFPLMTIYPLWNHEVRVRLNRWIDRMRNDNSPNTAE